MLEVMRPSDTVHTSFETEQSLTPARLRAAFGTFPTGVVAVAAHVDDRPVGLAASSFTPVSLEPPLVSFSIANTSRTWAAWFDTTIDLHVTAGDHTIVLLRLHAAAHVDRSLPLVFHRSGFGLRRSA